MKKKKINFIVVIILILALIPIPMKLKDGGSVEYKAILYEVTKYHTDNLNDGCTIVYLSVDN